MTTASPRDPFVSPLGLAPRYMRSRMAEAPVEQAAPKALPVTLETAPRVDTVTAELRRRILAAGEVAPHRLPNYQQLAPIAGLAKPLGAFITLFAAVAAQGAFPVH